MSENKNIKKIPLTQGQFAIVDNKDFEWLNQYKWYAVWEPHIQGFYAMRHSKTIRGKRYMISMAREILGLKYGNKKQTDHINHQTLYNCRANLRVVTLQQNLWNRKRPKGYSWNKRAKKYKSRIRLNGKEIHLGYFRTDKEANNAYLKAKKIYHKIGA